jgi:hypothetical protein
MIILGLGKTTNSQDRFPAIQYTAQYHRVVGGRIGRVGEGTNRFCLELTAVQLEQGDILGRQVLLFTSVYIPIFSLREV